MIELEENPFYVGEENPLHEKSNEAEKSLSLNLR